MRYYGLPFQNMKLIRKTSAFTLIELLVVISIIGILATLAVPAVQNALVQGQMTGTLSNARQLHLATQTMSLDTFSAGGDGMEWTSTNNNGTTTPASISTYFGALTNNNYLTESDLKKLTTAPGRGPGNNAPSAQNICFKIFGVQESSPSDQPLFVTANWSSQNLTTDSPYGKKGFVVFAKGGSGGIYKRTSDVTSTNIFPKTGQGGEGTTYNYTTLQ